MKRGLDQLLPLATSDLRAAFTVGTGSRAHLSNDREDLRGQLDKFAGIVGHETSEPHVPQSETTRRLDTMPRKRAAFLG